MKDLIAQVEAKELTLEQALKYTYEQGKQDADAEKTTIEYLKKNLLAVLEDNKLEIFENEDRLGEWVEGWVPIYNQDLVQVLASDTELGFSEYHHSDVFELLRSTIYERLYSIANIWLYQIKEGAIKP